MSDPAPGDEYIVTYKHLNKRLSTIHWESKDDDVNRRLALEHAVRAAGSIDVSEVQVARRPRTPWEPVDWRPKSASSVASPYDECMETSDDAQ